MADEKRKEWECDLPPVDTLPSEALDEEVSTWCILLASDLKATLEPPPLVRPWILARLVCAAALCAFEYHTDDAAPAVSSHAVGEFLVDGWHGLMRQKWNMLVTADSETGG